MELYRFYQNLARMGRKVPFVMIEMNTDACNGSLTLSNQSINQSNPGDPLKQS